MRKLESYLRAHRLKKRFYIVVVFGKKLQELYPDSLIINEEMAISYYWLPTTTLESKIKNLQNAIFLVNKIIESKPFDTEILNRSIFNHTLFIKELEPILVQVNYKLFKSAIIPRLFSLPILTFSITTCRRLSEFKQTMNSFLQNFQDLHLIHRWLCIDDNSSVADQKEMETLYPFFEFVWKSSNQKGHPKSMQMLTSLVKTPFLIHIEDDRMLINKRHYVKDMLDILDHDPHIGQVVFNHNYSETSSDDIRGGIEKMTDNKVKYYEHEYCPTEELQTQFKAKHGNVCNCNYYPHFSLSPSIIRTEVFKKIAFENELKFEYMFAHRYTQAGYKTAFLPGYHFKHIGRLTSDKTSLKYNAYDLLDYKQFFEPLKYKSFLINLDRRPDRYERIKTMFHYLPPNLKRVKACDGQFLIKTNRLRSLCKKCDYAMRPGVIGCALSHLKLYKQLLEDSEVNGYLIFEDDVTPDDTFLAKVSRTFSILQNGKEYADLIFFSCVLKPNHSFTKQGVVRKFNRQHINNDCIGGTGCYYISKKAAQEVFDYVEKNTLDVAIDAVLYNISHLVYTYFVQPSIISQLDPFNSSDIQHDHFIKSVLFEEQVSEDMYDKYIVYGEDGKIDVFDYIKFRCIEGFEKQISMKMYNASDF